MVVFKCCFKRLCYFISPFQDLMNFVFTQGVAPGYYVSPLWGYKFFFLQKILKKMSFGFHQLLTHLFTTDLKTLDPLPNNPLTTCLYLNTGLNNHFTISCAAEKF
jgi:hypothetical protein